MPQANMEVHYSCLGKSVWPPSPLSHITTVIPSLLEACESPLHSSPYPPKSYRDEQAQFQHSNIYLLSAGSHLTSETGRPKSLCGCGTDGVNRP